MIDSSLTERQPRRKLGRVDICNNRMIHDPIARR